MYLVPKTACRGLSVIKIFIFHSINYNKFVLFIPGYILTSTNWKSKFYDKRKSLNYHLRINAIQSRNNYSNS